MRIIAHTEEADRLIRAIIDNLDLRKSKLGEQVAAILRDDIRKQFSVGGVPPWQALAPSTVEAKRRMGYPRLNRMGKIPSLFVQNGHFGPENILIRTGALISSYTDESDPHNVTRIGSDFVEIGSALDYASSHQTGSPDGKPPRRPLTITPEAQALAAAAIEKATEVPN